MTTAAAGTEWATMRGWHVKLTDSSNQLNKKKESVPHMMFVNWVLERT
jgi:hypothetical protein